jgi:hypothetical protein
LDLLDIDTGDQQCKIVARHLDRTLRWIWRRRPSERALLESTLEKPEARAVSEQQLQSIAAFVAEDEEMSRHLILPEDTTSDSASVSNDFRRSVAPAAR